MNAREYRCSTEQQIFFRIHISSDMSKTIAMPMYRFPVTVSELITHWHPQMFSFKSYFYLSILISIISSQ